MKILSSLAHSTTLSSFTDLLTIHWSTHHSSIYLSSTCLFIIYLSTHYPLVYSSFTRLSTIYPLIYLLTYLLPIYHSLCYPLKSGVCIMLSSENRFCWIVQQMLFIVNNFISYSWLFETNIHSSFEVLKRSWFRSHLSHHYSFVSILFVCVIHLSHLSASFIWHSKTHQECFVQRRQKRKRMTHCWKINQDEQYFFIVSKSQYKKRFQFIFVIYSS